MPPAVQIEVEPFALEARFAATTVDAERRTVEITWTTGARGTRRRWRGYEIEEYEEELEVTDKAVRLDRLNAGAPFLESHRQWGGIDAQLGIIERAWIEGGKGHALVRFRQTEKALEVMRDIADGTLGAVSVGYRVHHYEDVSEGDRDAKRVLRATDWEPYEVSIVSMPFDTGATTRSHRQPDRYSVPVTTRTSEARAGGADETMDEDEETTPANGEQRAAEPSTPASPAPAPAVDVKAERAAAAAAERERATQVRRACLKAGLAGSDLESRLLEDGTGIDAARAQIIDALEARDSEAPAHRGVSIGVEELTKVRDAAENALLNRVTSGSVELTEAGREIRGFGLLGLGVNLLEARGIRTAGMSKTEVCRRLLGRSQSTSDFKAVLENVGQKTLRREYDELEPTFEFMVRRTTNPDFKPTKRVQLSAAPPLKQKAEGAPYGVGSMTDGAESTELKDYGVIIEVTRQTIINDDLGAFARIVPAQARRARELEADLVYDQLTSNPVMADGEALFSAAHNNTGAGVIGEAGLTAAYEKIRLQKGLKGERLSLRMAHLLVPVKLRIAGEKFINQNIVAAKASDTNVFRTMGLGLVDDPRLDDSSLLQWYGVADKAQVDLIELVFLQDQIGPQFEEDEDFRTGGLAFKVNEDVSAHVIDWRGFYRSTGA